MIDDETASEAGSISTVRFTAKGGGSASYLAISGGGGGGLGYDGWGKMLAKS
jgi:hypothetical protein